jgi:hypothetical protein
MAIRPKRHRQRELFPPSKRSAIAIDPSHPLVRLCDMLAWNELIEKAEEIRAKRLKSQAGRPPNLRALLGAMLLRATKRMTFRDAEDQIRYYAPARYLCGLSDSDWSPDHDTIHEFTQSMGEEGARLINEYVVKLAASKKLADPSVAVGDTTAQEAAIPYPNEMRLMAAFMSSIAVGCARGGDVLRRFLKSTAPVFDKAKKKIRAYHLFAKTKEKRLQVMGQVAKMVGRIHAGLAAALTGTSEPKNGRRAAARGRVRQLHETMTKLLPQIRYWLRTGKVARNKIVSLQMPEVHSIVRGKTGKPVEFGMKWGFTRLGGGYLLAQRGAHKLEMEDKRFVVRAVDDIIELFGQAPNRYAYDRGGFSHAAVAALKSKGVRHVALAPTGKVAWAVSSTMRRRMVRERAMVEGGIGAVKSSRYGFNRPAARSTKMMAVSGQLAVLGFNLNKLVRETA